MTTFELLQNRYWITLNMENLEDLHPGSGLESETSQAAAILRRDGQPFIAGSSLRGLLRATAERTMTSLFGPGQRNCVQFEESDAFQTTDAICMAGNPTTRKQLETAEDPNRPPLDTWKLCPVCRLFGSTLMAGKLKVGDILLGDKNSRIAVRAGVGIDRDTGSAKEAIKFDFELWEQRSSFQMQWTVENAETEEFALLYILISELQRGVDCGGLKNRGFGRIRCKSIEVKQITRANLPQYLLGEAPATLPADAFQTELRNSFDQLFLMSQPHA